MEIILAHKQANDMEEKYVSHNTTHFPILLYTESRSLKCILYILELTNC